MSGGIFHAFAQESWIDFHAELARIATATSGGGSTYENRPCGLAAGAFDTCALGLGERARLSQVDRAVEFPGRLAEFVEVHIPIRLGSRISFHFLRRPFRTVRRSTPVSGRA